MSNIQYEEGKVYLRDVRNGQIHLYERHLAANKNFESVVPNEVATPDIELDENTEITPKGGE
jgi:hypothetical protein